MHSCNTNRSSSACENSFTYTVVDHPLCIREGNDFRLGFRFKDVDDLSVPLDNVQTILFKARYGFKGSIALSIPCEVDDPTAGTFWVPFTATNTSGLGGRSGFSEYRYDIEFTYNDGRITSYMEGVLTVKSDV